MPHHISVNCYRVTVACQKLIYLAIISFVFSFCSGVREKGNLKKIFGYTQEKGKAAGKQECLK